MIKPLSIAELPYKSSPLTVANAFFKPSGPGTVRAMDTEALAVALFAIGAGAINTMVGGGTYIMLPVLAVFLGVDAQVGNATNRLAVGFQGLAAATTLRRKGVLPFGACALPVAIAVVGGAVGAYVATVLSPEVFSRWVGWLLIGGLPLLFLPRPDPEKVGQRPKAPAIVALFLLGVYGGFLGAGVGVLFLLVLPPLLRSELVQTVAIKVVVVLTMSLAAGAVYLWRGFVDWQVFVPLVIGYMIGGVIGARLTIKVGDRWMRVVVAVVAAGLAIAMLVRG